VTVNACHEVRRRQPTDAHSARQAVTPSTTCGFSARSLMQQFLHASVA
jgi:hypothetical protein